MNYAPFDSVSSSKSLNKCSEPEDNDMAATATKGIFDADDLDPVTKLFFSNKNIKRIQRHIKEEICKRTNGQYRLTEDQDENDLLVAMRAVYLDENGSRYLPYKIVRQVKELNDKVVKYVVPDMIVAIKQYYGYIKEISEPLKPIMRPMNVSSAGRKQLSGRPLCSIYKN
jgi:hypothetical protein